MHYLITSVVQWLVYLPRLWKCFSSKYAVLSRKIKDWCVLSGVTTNSNFIFFGLTLQRLELTIFRTSGEHHRCFHYCRIFIWKRNVAWMSLASVSLWFLQWFFQDEVVEVAWLTCFFNLLQNFSRWYWYLNPRWQSGSMADSCLVFSTLLHSSRSFLSGGNLFAVFQLALIVPVIEHLLVIRIVWGCLYLCRRCVVWSSHRHRRGYWCGLFDAVFFDDVEYRLIFYSCWIWCMCHYFFLV